MEGRRNHEGEKLSYFEEDEENYRNNKMVWAKENVYQK